MMQRVAIIGLGLIGGSLALAWKERRKDLTIVGHDKPDVLKDAIARGMVSEAAASVQEAVTGADLVVFAVPLDSMGVVLRQAAPYLKPGAVVTDTGSVKSPVAQEAEAALSADNPYVGGHPMAGAEKGGIAQADAFLFENAAYILCPKEDDNMQQWTTTHAALLSIIESTGARVFLIDPAVHDRVAAAISHLPQLVATALMTFVGEQQQDAYIRLAAGGFRDMTRIAASPWALWQPILEFNRQPVLQALQQFRRVLQQLTDAIEQSDTTALHNAFRKGRHTRDSIPRDTRGFLYPLSDIYVYAKDRPGVLAHIANTLFDDGINIKDIALLRIREGTGGAFRLSFENDDQAEAAVTSLENAGCRAQRL